VLFGSDYPLITPDRWLADFDGARDQGRGAAADPEGERHRPAGPKHLASGGALIVLDRRNGCIIGTTRFHGYDPARSEIEIGWTFLARSHWGGDYNGEMKRLMLEHAFGFVDRVVFLIHPQNIRSQRAVEKLGAVRAGSRLDGGGRDSLVYEIRREPGSEATRLDRTGRA
jgi:RimJ/RimL family protein N-acetyltransferase